MPDKKLDVRVYPIEEPKGNTIAFASVAIDDLVAIRGIRIVETEKGAFASMPQTRNKNSGEYQDVAFPTDNDLRKVINKAVLGEYKRVALLAPEQRSYEKPEKGAASDIPLSGISLDIKLYPIPDSKNKTKAFANVIIDDTVTINAVRVVESEKGIHVFMPQSQDSGGNLHDIAFPINGDLRKALNKAVLDKYEARDFEKPIDKSLADGLRRGAEKAAENAAVPREAAAKSRPGVLE
jgi:stage V sporulation protein G